MCSDGGEGAWRVGCQQGAERERKHIIEMLEHNQSAIRELYLSAEGALKTYYGAQLDILMATIALIKGEQK